MRPKVKSDYRRKKNCIVMVFEKFPEILVKGHSASGVYKVTGALIFFPTLFGGS